MDRRTKFMLVASAMLAGAPAQAAPPTVTPSPGYDARLQESRKATTTSDQAPSTPANAPVAPRHHPPRKHGH